MRCRPFQQVSRLMREDGILPVICPTCQNFFALKSSEPATMYLCMGLFSIFCYSASSSASGLPGTT
jgi:hypothetical protein